MKNYRTRIVNLLQLLSSLAIVYLLMIPALPHAHAAAVKGSVFFPPELMTSAKSNATKYPWADRIRGNIVDAASPWLKYSDDELWEMMFGNTIKRSWMVWSNGFCPSCKKSVPMYNWVADPLAHPWKMCCPHCKEYFPKNDFGAYYRSGLDSHGIFDPKQANRKLLFNAEHPDPKDPLHLFGVDDGDGYVQGDKRWRFIGTYLIRGQWKGTVVGGIRALSDAYVMTGDRAYAHKALVLLDRVADVYPTFDFYQEGIMYEGEHISNGYVSTWHDACGEVRVLTEAYDKVRGAADDPALVSFLSKKAKERGIDNPKSSPDDIRRNIEDRILKDTLEHRPKIESNYPQTDMACIAMKTVLGWPENRKEVESLIDDMIDKSTAFDGLSGEKGLAEYSSFAPQGLALFLSQYTRIDPLFLKSMLKRHPKLYQAYRFYIDAYCLNRYYPHIGDTGAFGKVEDRYAGTGFSDWPMLSPSMYTFMGQMYKETGDPAFIQVAYNGNRGSVENLPYDMFASDPSAYQKMMSDVVAKKGRYPKVGSVDKQEWHLGILRSGKDGDARALWMQYDSGADHGHFNGMNLGLFAKGLDLMPDFGYPPVQFGGWGAPKANWYTMSAAHNTVVVDGQNHQSNLPNLARGRCTAGKTTLWADGSQFHALRVSGPEMIGGKEFERTAILCDLSDRDFYVLDIFRVVGGTDHAKFLHSYYGQITSRGMTLMPTSDYGNGTQMRNFRFDRSPQAGWSVDWKIDDRYRYRSTNSNVHLKYIDLTAGAQAYTAEDWIACGFYGSSEEAWIPCVMTRRKSAQGPLESTFVSIIEPYENASNIASTRRLPLESLDGTPYPEANTAVEVVTTGGYRDLFISADVENPLHMVPSISADKILVQKESGVRTDAELCMVRRQSGGQVQKIALCRGSVVVAGNTTLRMKKAVDFVEVRLNQGRPILITGNPADVQSVTVNGKNVWR